jgi:hypothetical protein
MQRPARVQSEAPEAACVRSKSSELWRKLENRYRARNKRVELAECSDAAQRRRRLTCQSAPSVNRESHAQRERVRARE